MNNIKINAFCKKSRKIKVYKNFEFCDGDAEDLLLNKLSGCNYA